VVLALVLAGVAGCSTVWDDVGASTVWDDVGAFFEY
jgi:hypothetical protein